MKSSKISGNITNSNLDGYDNRIMQSYWQPALALTYRIFVFVHEALIIMRIRFKSSHF